MATLTRTASAGPAQTAPARNRRRRSLPVWRWAILLVAAVYFLLPLWGALRFSGISAFGGVVDQPGFTTALWLSVRLAIITTVITLVLMVPTTVYVHLRLPKLRRVLDTVTLLPIVIPPVVLIIGVLKVARVAPALQESPYLLALEYVILAMPFAYRSIDAGLRALDLKTLTEASSNLGAGWITTLWRVILPNLTTALLSATVLTVALVLGEYTMATLDLFTTFPVWIVTNDQVSAQGSVAASLLALFVTWLVLMLITTVGTRQSRRRGGGEVTLFTAAPSQTIGN
jgi:putative spermidine/putrescine transport system permease protein